MMQQVIQFMHISTDINLTFKTKMKVNNPKELEYWRNIFPNKTDSELEEYRVRWSKENPKYLKFERL